MSETSNEFSAVAITEDQWVAWPRVAGVAAMVAFSLPTFITGLEIYEALGPKAGLWALFIGSLIIFVIGAVMGTIGAKTRLSSYLLVRIAFGDKGAGLVNIAFAISLLGWFGVNINLFEEALTRLGQDVFGLTLPALPLAIFASACMTITTLIGFRAINWLAALLVPVLAVVTLLLARSALSAPEIAPIQEATMTLGQGVSAVVGAIIIGAIILPDITRFTRHWTGAIYTAFIAYIVVQLAVMVAAGLAGATSASSDILDIMLELGLGMGAFIIVIAGSWVLNSLNLYSAVLGTKATFPKLSTTWLTIGLGLIGVGAALMNILDAFITFIFYLSIVFIPVAGVIMADVLLIRPSAYRLSTLEANRAVAPKAFIAWAVGAGYTLLTEMGVMPSPTKMAAIDAIILSGALYLLLSWRDREA